MELSPSASTFAAISLAWPSEGDFLDHWSAAYNYPDAELYDPNIGKPLTEQRLWELFRWKNGGAISAGKRASIVANYPVEPPPDPAARYLNPQAPGGAIWNIFYLHCLDPERWPIYDQHAHRAMVWLQDRCIDELPMQATRKAKATVYSSYQGRFIPFLRAHFLETDLRRIDRALFSFGRLLKEVAPHCRPPSGRPERNITQHAAMKWLTADSDRPTVSE